MPPHENERLARIEAKLDSLNNRLVGEGSSDGLFTQVEELRNDVGRAKGALGFMMWLVGALGLVQLVQWFRGGQH